MGARSLCVLMDHSTDKQRTFKIKGDFPEGAPIADLWGGPSGSQPRPDAGGLQVLALDATTAQGPELEDEDEGSAPQYTRRRRATKNITNTTRVAPQ